MTGHDVLQAVIKFCVNVKHVDAFRQAAVIGLAYMDNTSAAVLESVDGEPFSVQEARTKSKQYKCQYMLHRLLQLPCSNNLHMAPWNRLV